MKNRGRVGNSKLKTQNLKVKQKAAGLRSALHASRSTKKTILFPEYFPFIAGGQVVLLNIIKHLKENYNIRVVVFNRGKIEKELAKLGISCDYMPAPRNARKRYLWKSIPLYLRLKKYIAENKVDLVYVNGYFTAKLTGPAAKAAGVPMIWHKHQIVTEPKGAYLSRQIKEYSRYAGRIICVSDASRHSLEKLGIKREMLVTVHNGMDIPAAVRGSAKQVRKKHGLEKAFIAGTVGYFRKNKGIDILIKAAAIVKEIQPGIKFLIAGAAEPGGEAYERELKRMAEGLKGTVIFAGRQERFEYLPAFDVFVLSSYDEPFALSVLEALGSGVPVIAFKSGGTPEIVKDGYNGYLAGEVDAKALADKILLAYKNRRGLKKLSRNAALTVKKKFGLKAQMEKIRKIIEDVI